MNIWQRCPVFEEVLWHFDPAAYGPRARAFVEDENGRKAVLGAYEDGWSYVESSGLSCGTLEWKDATQDLAKKRAFRLWQALAEPIA